MSLDPVALTARSTPSRSEAAQGISFDLDIAAFLNPESFRITGVQLDNDGDIVLEFSHAHPFPAPDISLPQSSLNRADLGYTGRVIFMADGRNAAPETRQTFFSSDRPVQLDPTLVKNADGYVQCRSLLSASGLTNDTFPYMLLADEAKENRDGHKSFGGQGNYAAIIGGWQRANLGDGSGWTGYDFVHGGQTVRNSITFRRQALQSGPLTLQVALLIKYTDPRGSSGGEIPRKNRLPAADSNPLKFAYRLPHAALDVSKVEVTREPSISDLPDRCDSGFIRIRDWDSVSSETTFSDLSQDSNVRAIFPGTAGGPLVEVDAPFLASALFPGAVAEAGFGAPGEELQSKIVLSNELGTLVPAVEPYLALVRVTDPENNTNDAYHFGLDPVTLAPLAESVPLVTYQVLPVTCRPEPTDAPNAPPEVFIASSNLSMPCEDPGQPSSTSTFTVMATNSPTGYLWDFGQGGFPLTPLAQVTQVILANEPGTFVGTVTATNGFGTSQPYEFVYTVGAPQTYYPPPTWSIHDLGPLGISSILDMDVVNNRIIFVTGSGEVYVAQVEFPNNPSNWVMHLLPSPSVLSEENHVDIADNRVVSGTKSGTDVLIQYTTSSPPNATGDWQSVIADSFPAGCAVQGAVWRNNRIIAIVEDAFSSILYAEVATVANPLSAADFTRVQLEANAARGPGAKSIVVYDGGRLAIQYRRNVLTAEQTILGISNRTGNPVIIPTTVAGSTGRLFVLNGRLATGVDTVIFSTAVVPTTEQDWTPSVSIPGAQSNLVYENRLVGITREGAALDWNIHAKRALVSTPTSPLDFQDVLVADEGIVDLGSSIAKAAQFQDRLVVIYSMNPPGTAPIRVAISDQAW